MKNVFYINLDERVERRISCEDQLKKLNWKFERFSAIKHKNGAIGCAKSHLAILEKAKKNNLDYVVIFEDDFIIQDIDKFKRVFQSIIKEKPYFDVLKLGGNPYPPYKKITKNYVNLFYSQTTHAYMVLSHYYDILIKNYKESIFLLNKFGTGPLGIFACDAWQNILVNKFNHTWLIINPLLVSQRELYSDIEKKKIKYNWYCLNFKNTDKRLYIVNEKMKYPLEKDYFSDFTASKIKHLINNYEIVSHLLKNIK